MDEMLTSRQVQELLNVDRITVYRMLKDGRLKGVKVGHQWRFPRKQIEALVSGALQTTDRRLLDPTEALPIHCLQVIQDVFAEVAEVGSITTDPDGQPITEISNSCAFCNLILANPAGFQGCVASWRKLAEMPGSDPRFIPCHAGLQYARGRIELDGELTGILVAGQFYVQEPDPEEEAARVRLLATTYHIDPEALAAAAADIRRLDERREAQIGSWLVRVAHTFEEIGHERAELLDRLRQIAEMSAIATSAFEA